MEDLFNMDLTHVVSLAREYLRRHDPQRLQRINEQVGEELIGIKGFMITADGSCSHSGIHCRVLCVFPTFIVSGHTTGGSYDGSFDIDTHTLGHNTLIFLKLYKLNYYNDDTISKVISKFRTLEEQVKPMHQIEFDRSVKQFEKEKVAQELKVVRQAFELEEARHILERDRQAFERERQDLERELAKYKGIVGGCLKEIETYLE